MGSCFYPLRRVTNRNPLGLVANQSRPESISNPAGRGVQFGKSTCLHSGTMPANTLSRGRGRRVRGRVPHEHLQPAARAQFHLGTWDEVSAPLYSFPAFPRDRGVHIPVSGRATQGARPGYNQ
jgi:hypothetical protein